MMTLQDVLADNYYVAYYDIDTYPTIIKTTTNGGFWKASGMRRLNKEEAYSFYPNNSFGCSKDIRKATPEEAHWLNCCIEKRNIVSFEEAMGSFIKEEPITYSNEPDSKLNEILIRLLTIK